MFRRLVHFAGGFDLAAAEAVATDEGIDVYSDFDVLGRLVDRSLVLFDSSVDRRRYRLLETMKQYGAEQLVAAGAPGNGDPNLTNFPVLNDPPDGTTIPRDSTFVITRKDGGIVGS